MSDGQFLGESGGKVNLEWWPHKEFFESLRKKQHVVPRIQRNMIADKPQRYVKVARSENRANTLIELERQLQKLKIQLQKLQRVPPTRPPSPAEGAVSSMPVNLDWWEYKDYFDTLAERRKRKCK